MISIRIGSVRILIRAIVTFAWAVASLAGCAGGAVVATSESPSPPWWEPHLTVDRDLKARGLREIRLFRSRSESGFLRIAGEYVNRSDAKLSAVYRFTWLDESGMPVESILSNWEAVHALPRARATFSGIAPRADIQHFRVELMAAHRLKGQPVRGQADR